MKFPRPKPVPDGYHTLTPMLVVKDARAAIDFYQRALGATERARFADPNGTIMHAELTIGDSLLMLAGESPSAGFLAPVSLSGSSSSLYVYVEDVDGVVDQAVKAGAHVTMPVGDMFWGDRCGTVRDPSGHTWTVATHKEDLTPEQIRQRGEQFFASLAQR